MLKPHDILTLDDRLWIVSGVFLGSLGSESLIGLRSHSHGDGSACGKPVSEMMVPVVMVEALLDHGVVRHHPDRAALPPATENGE